MDPNKIKASSEGEKIAKIYNPEGFSPFPYENILKDKKDLDILLTSFEKDEVSGVVL